MAKRTLEQLKVSIGKMIAFLPNHDGLRASTTNKHEPQRLADHHYSIAAHSPFDY